MRGGRGRALAVKEGVFSPGSEKAQHKIAREEVKSLRLAKGRQHIIQEVKAGYHSLTDTGFRTVTRSVRTCSDAVALHLPFKHVCWLHSVLSTLLTKKCVPAKQECIGRWKLHALLPCALVGGGVLERRHSDACSQTVCSKHMHVLMTAELWRAVL